jgi:hypothetical protein
LEEILLFRISKRPSLYPVHVFGKAQTADLRLEFVAIEDSVGGIVRKKMRFRDDFFKGGKELLTPFGTDGLVSAGVVDRDRAGNVLGVFFRGELIIRTALSTNKNAYTADKRISVAANAMIVFFFTGR